MVKLAEDPFFRGNIDTSRIMAAGFSYGGWTALSLGGLTDLLPQARTERLAPAFHFTAMPLCKPEAPQILEAEQDDPVCTDPDGTDRAAVHAKIIETILEQLAL